MNNTHTVPTKASTMNAKVAAGIYFIFMFLFCFIGLIGTIILAAGSERDGILAVKVLAGPASFALSGFVASLAAMFLLKDKPTYQIIVPIGVSLLFGFTGMVGVFIVCSKFLLFF